MANLNAKKLTNVLKIELPEWRHGAIENFRNTSERIP
jgi:hypothetical protein